MYNNDCTEFELLDTKTIDEQIQLIRYSNSNFYFFIIFLLVHLCTIRSKS